MAEVEHDFENLVQTIMGVTPQRAGRGQGARRPDSPLPPGFGFGPPGQPPSQTQMGGPLMG